MANVPMLAASKVAIAAWTIRYVALAATAIPKIISKRLVFVVDSFRWDLSIKTTCDSSQEEGQWAFCQERRIDTGSLLGSDRSGFHIVALSRFSKPMTRVRFPQPAPKLNGTTECKRNTMERHYQKKKGFTMNCFEEAGHD